MAVGVRPRALAPARSLAISDGEAKTPNEGRALWQAGGMSSLGGPPLPEGYELYGWLNGRGGSPSGRWEELRIAGALACFKT